MTRKEILEKTIDFDDAVNRIVRLEKENAELKCECRRCVYTDSPCVRSDYPSKDGVCSHYKNVFDENTELKTKVTALENANRAMVKELDDTTSGGLNILQNVVKNKEELTNAKELIKKLKALYLSPVVTNDDVKRQDEILNEAEQFLKDCEVE